MATKKTMLDESIAAYLTHCETALGHSENTLNSARLILHQFLRHTGNKQVVNVTHQHVYDWFYGPSGLMSFRISANRNYKRNLAPLTASSHNLYRAKAVGFFKYCLERGLVRSNPMMDIRPRKVPKKVRQRPSPHVLLTLLDTAKLPRDRGYLATAMNTALRSSEICSIYVSQVDLAAGVLRDVHIRKTGDYYDQPITSDLATE